VARRLIVAVIALLLAITIVRNAFVSALAGTDPENAARLWRDHPSVQISAGMIAIATAAYERSPVSPAVLTSFYEASRKNPLAPEPFLVRGVQAQIAGNQDLARQAFAAAKSRDPRSLPARYFLAQDDFSRGDAASGLREVVVLARLAPNGSASLAPYLATYALDRSNWPQLREVLRADPYLAEATFIALAANPANADTILALADERQRDPRKQWVTALLTNLVKGGQYQKARDVWANMSRVGPEGQAPLFDPKFSNGDAPPPFNWALTSSTVGLAERRPGGGLHVIYYGQEDGVLASQLVLLPPGRYRITMRTPGTQTNDEPLQWRLLCVGSKAEIGMVPFRTVADRGWTFAVPSTCRAQRIELFGISSDMPQQIDVTVAELKLTPDSGNG
jgi:hypothetical protein